MRLHYVPNDLDGPGFYRCFIPASQLVENGHKATFQKMKDHGQDHPHRFEIEFKEQQICADAYIFQQPKHKFVSHRLIESLHMQGVPVIVDIDDNYVELPAGNPALLGLNPWYHRGLGRVMSRKDRRNFAKAFGVPLSALDRPNDNMNWENLHRSCSEADLLTVSTPHLAEIYSRFNKNVMVVRNYLDWRIWDDIEPQCDVERERLRVGYLAAFSFHHPDLWVLKSWFSDWLKANPNVDFVTNDLATHEFLEVPEEQRITIGRYDFFPDDKGEYPVGRMTAVCDIGLVPLEMNGFNEGKSHLKGMEYNAAGIPFIASPTESYRYWADEGGVFQNGLLARDSDEWTYHLDNFVRDDDYRRLCGATGRAKAEEHTIQKTWPIWEYTIQSVAGGEFKERARECVRLGSIQKPSELGGFLEKVSALKPKSIVEIGTARGGTLFGMLSYADNEAVAYSIDIPAGSVNDHVEGEDVYQRPDDNREMIRKRIACVGQLVKLIDEDSQKVETFIKLKHMMHPKKKIDLLFIDGDHTYEGVKRDFELYSPLVRKGGLIAFHDIVDHERETVGVWRLWEEIKQRDMSRCSEFVDHRETWGVDAPWGGIGVLRV